MIRLTREQVARYDRWRRRTWIYPVLWILFGLVSFLAALIPLYLVVGILGLENASPVMLPLALAGPMILLWLLRRLSRRLVQCPACGAVPPKHREIFPGENSRGLDPRYKLEGTCHQCKHPLTLRAYDHALELQCGQSSGVPYGRK